MSRRSLVSTVKPLSVAIWTRVSSKQQANEGYSLQVQEDQLRGLAALNKWEVVKHIPGEGESAFVGKRDKFNVALDFMSQGGADVLMCSHLDRLTRRVRECQDVMDRSEAEGWGLVIAGMGATVLDTRDPMVWTFIMMQAVMGEGQSRDKSVRVLQGQERARANPDKKFGNPNVIPPEVMKRMMRYDRKGHSAGQIARMLDMDGVPTARGALRWSRQTVHAAISREKGHRCPSELARRSGAKKAS